MRPQRFVPGFFQRSVVDIEEEIEDQKKYVQRWEKRVRDYKHKLEEIAQSRTKLRGLMGSKYNAYNRQNEKTFAEQLEEVQAKYDDAQNVVRSSRAELQALLGLRKGSRFDATRFSKMYAMINTNFAETYADKVCSSSYTEIVSDINFPDEDEPSYEYNVGLFPCARKKRRPIFLKLEQPGHLFCALIFPEENLCEIWDTSDPPPVAQQYFAELLPHYYTIVCLNAQLQVKWCESGEENVYTVKQPGITKPMVNIYCQSWPYFFAYMRCIKRFSALDVLKFLSCLSDAQKTQLIDAFNTALSNRGKDIQYISEINDERHFQNYVRQCDPLIDWQKTITYVSRDDNTSFDFEDGDEFAAQLRKYIKSPFF